MILQNTVNDRPIVGIFQAEWPLQSQTIFCAQMLAEAGFRVELFLYDTRDFAGLDRLKNVPGISIHHFDRDEIPAPRRNKIPRKRPPAKLRTFKDLLYKKCFDFAAHLYRYSHFPVHQNLLPLPSWLLRSSEKIIAAKKFHAFIGVEKKGLSWAGRLGITFNIPFIYHSLELYGYGHPDLYQLSRGIRAKIAEEYFHRKSMATIIQNPERGEVLLRDNGLRDHPLLYLPVSVLGDPVRNKGKGTYLQEKFHLPKDQILIIQFGLFYDRRYTVELVRTAQNFPENWSLVLHGFGLSAEYVSQIREMNRNEKVILSLDLVPAESIPEVIRSAHIGLCFYSPENDNDRLTAYSSEKMALYHQGGLPFISFDYPDYREVADRLKSGVVIPSLGQLPEAVQRILSSYETFRENALRGFSDCYDYAKNFQRVIRFLETR